MKLKVKLTGAVSAIALSLTAVVAQADVLFWSTQAKPVEEAQAMRDQVLEYIKLTKLSKDTDMR